MVHNILYKKVLVAQLDNFLLAAFKVRIERTPLYEVVIFGRPLLLSTRVWLGGVLVHLVANSRRSHTTNLDELDRSP